MGMAASQARLLTITARIHDVEYAAQAIQSAKIQLATQSDQVYQNYLEALDATTLTLKNYDGERVAANFNNLCGINRIDSMYAYSLYDEKGLLIVPEDIYEGYQNFLKDGSDLKNDPYAFAMYMLDPDNAEKVFNFYNDDGKNLADLAIGSDATTDLYKYQNRMNEILASEDSYERDEDGKSLKDNGYSSLKEDVKKEYDELEQKRNYLIYRQFAQQIYEGESDSSAPSMQGGIDSFDQSEFDYYATYYKQIQQAGGCVSIAQKEYNGINGDAANDSDWLKKMIQSGKITVDTWTVDTKSGALTLASTGVSSDTCLEYTTTSTIDKTALAKAEAEYEYKTKQIDKKDKQYDNELSKLETERTALTTEYDSVKKVISDNIERTFGIFS